MESPSPIKTDNLIPWSALAFWDGPHSVCGVCFSLKKSTSHLSLISHWILSAMKHQEPGFHVVLTPGVISVKRPWVQVTFWVDGFSSVQLLSHVWLFAIPWTAAHQASLSITNSQSPPKPMSMESMMPSNHLILCRPLLLLPSIFPSIRVFSNESALCIRWPEYWSFSFSISPSNEHPGQISFRMDWLDLLAGQGVSCSPDTRCVISVKRLWVQVPFWVDGFRSSQRW